MIIAEAGINHNGNLEYAKKLAYEAKESGADVVKFQTHNLTFDDITRLKDYSLDKNEWYQLRSYCNDIDIKFMSTPHTFEAIHFLDSMVSIHKIAHTYLGLSNFLVEVAKKNKPILLSTGSIIHDNGMATIEEIRNALSFIPDADITLLHCISKYPCYNPHYERIDELKELGYKVGLSDHSKTIQVPKGLPVYEKHFMLTDIPCIDSNVSLNPDEFKEMVKWIKY